MQLTLQLSELAQRLDMSEAVRSGSLAELVKSDRVDALIA